MNDELLAKDQEAQALSGRAWQAFQSNNLGDSNSDLVHARAEALAVA